MLAQVGDCVKKKKLFIYMNVEGLRRISKIKNFFSRNSGYSVFCLFSAVVGIVIHPGEQFFGGAPDHVVAAGRARARV